MNMPANAATPAAKPPVTINAEQRLFVIRTGDGFSCYGFDNCRASCEDLSAKLNRPDLNDPALIGTLKDYENYRTLVQLFCQSPQSSGTYFSPGTDVAVKRVLEEAREQRYTIRLHLGDRKTGQSWNEEWDVIGQVGRSMGPMRIPLLVAKGEHGGGAISTNSIVRIQRIKSGSLYDPKNSVDLYVHPLYTPPEFRWKRETKDDMLAKGYVAKVYNDRNINVANFKTEEGAIQYIDFMRGEAQTTKARKHAFA